MGGDERKAIPDLRSIDVFVTVVDCASMVAAARRLNLTQPAISKAVAQLEAFFGTSLLDRSQRPLRPTRAGRILHQRGADLLEAALNLSGLLNIAANETIPTLRIGVVESLTATGAPFVKGLQAIAKEVQFSCSLTPELARGLQQWDFDMIITSDPMEDEAELERFVLLEEPFILAMPSNLPVPTTLDAMRELARSVPLIRYTARSMIGKTIERHLSRARIESARQLEVDTTAPMLRMVAASLGWGITTPLCLLQGSAYLDSIVVVPLPHAPTRKLFFVRRKGHLDAVGQKIYDLASRLLTQVLTSSFQTLDWVMPEIKVGKDSLTGD